MNLKRFFAAAFTFATLMLVFGATAFAADGSARLYHGRHYVALQ